jgi:tetratricopeptide (TPR) repeat protein
MRRLLVMAVALAVLVPGVLAAQENATLQQARQAYENLEYERATTLAQQALREGLTTAEAITAWEITAYSNANMGNQDQAIAAFVELIYLDPTREPDAEQIAPRILNAWTTALGSVLVVREVNIEEREFVAGEGRVRIDFLVSRSSRATIRIVGEGYEQTLDEFLVARQGVVDWDALGADGQPVLAGDYEVVVEATELGNTDVRSQGFAVRHAPVDTVPHLTRLPGFDPLPEEESPPRDWKPFGVALLSTVVGGGVAMALESGDLEAGSRREVLSVSAAVLLAGFGLSLKPPDPRPVPANIQYNALLRQQIVQRNQEIATENAARRRQVLLTITPTTTRERVGRDAGGDQ